MQKHWGKILLLIFGALLITLYQRWWSAPEPVRSATLTTNQRNVGGMNVKAWTEVNRVPLGRDVTFWVHFENHSSKTFTALRICGVSVEGFRLDSACWDERGQPACVSGAASSLPAALPSGQSIEVRGTLTAGDEDGAFRPSVTLEWVDGTGQAHRDVIWLGPIQIVDPRSERIHVLGRRLLGVLKDILIPLLIFIGGVWYQKWSQEQAEANQIRQEMLPRMLADSQGHYLRILSRIVRLRRHLRDESVSSREGADECFWSLLLYIRQARRMTEKIGGFHFKNRLGERVVATCHHAILRGTEANFGFEKQSLMIESIRDGEAFGIFQARFRDGAPMEARELLREMRKIFDRWIADPDERTRLSAYGPCFEILALVTKYEINSPFVRWYGSPEEFPREELEKQQNLVKDRFADVFKTTQAYLEQRVPK